MSTKKVKPEKKRVLPVVQVFLDKETHALVVAEAARGGIAVSALLRTKIRDIYRRGARG